MIVIIHNECSVICIQNIVDDHLRDPSLLENANGICRSKRGENDTLNSILNKRLLESIVAGIG